MNSKERIIIYPLIVILISIIIGIAIFMVSNLYSKIESSWDQLTFTYQHPGLVKALQEKYASGSAELESKLTSTEVSASDKLIEAVASEVKLSK